MSAESPFSPPQIEPDLPPKAPKSRDSYKKGLLLGFLAHSLIGLTFVSELWVFFLLLFGVTQVVYQIPIIFYLRSKGLVQMSSGVLAAAGISFLLNAGVCGLCVGGSFMYERI